MKSLTKIIKSLNEQDLDKLEIMIRNRRHEIQIKNSLNFVPDIFKKNVEISFSNNYNGDDYYKYYEINSWGSMKLDTDVKLKTLYALHRGDDFNTNKVTMKLIIGEQKHTIEYDYCHDKNICLLKLNHKILLILDKLGLSKNNFHKNMLGILIHNFILLTQREIDFSDFEISMISIDQINKLNDKKSLNSKYINVSGFCGSDAIRFKYV
ncbi:hypothetical protein H012_gp111 [Acanthamoeba polyphaga moumouvirus]|uniref:Uncharacterized protein n=1 Tax=Acanthamoeba polyphaga moumouvirus TaxID=1269028 RepID=L7RDZ8_9VIRU|nr:hypothetical protein H012_gp111 [Acanthamoeba polyphaga moumouvirus]AGC02338.1 hypothetical protein Moumou_00821 [Acanthamoeba polyphaga moumouvirus]